MSTIALTRPVPDSLADCELTHLARVPIGVELARAQHAAYERALAALGCVVRRVPAAHDRPDSVFVEDVALVLDEVAIVTRPGAASRRPETSGVAETLGAFRPLRLLTPPATLDGGDVLQLGRVLYVGVGARTNDEGARQLAALVQPHDYEVHRVASGKCLHLKSAVTALGENLLLVNPEWIDTRSFDGCECVAVHPHEPLAANVLGVHGTILCASSHERTMGRIEAAGLVVRPIDMSELAKAEGALTCCSVIFEA